MDFLLFAVYAAVFICIVFYWNFFDVPGVKRKYFAGVFVLKLSCGIAFTQVYSDHYGSRKTGDAFRFFDDAVILNSSLEEGLDVYLKIFTEIGMREDERAMTYYNRMTHMQRPFYMGFFNDNATIIKANSLVLHFSRGNYYVHIAFWSFFTLIGLVAIYKLLAAYFPRKKAAMFLAVFLLPSVLFWASGVLKESILIMGLGLFVLGFFRWIYGEHSKADIFGLFLGFVLLLITKGYVLQCMAPAILGLILVKAFKGRKFYFWFALPHLLALILVFAGGYISDKLDVPRIMGLKQIAFANVAEQSNSGSAIELPEIRQSTDVIVHAPQALSTAYLRPWPWEWDKITYIPPALENLFLMICLLLMAWNFKKPYGLAIPILAFSASFALVMGVLTGEVVSIIGALVRYKVPSLIFLFVLVFGLTDHIKLQRRFPLIRKIVKSL